MSDLSHLADKFKAKLGFNQRPNSSNPESYNSGPSYPGASYYAQPPSYGQPPPSQWYPGDHAPPIPPRPPNSAAPPIPPRIPSDTYPSSAPSHAHKPNEHVASTAGALYPPGKYPTPELPLYPLQRHRILQPQHEHELTSSFIQDALNELGPSTTLYLPPRTKWRIHAPVSLHEYQELATFGYPTSHDEMAILDAQEDCRPHIVTAWEKPGVRIRNLIIEGNREKYGFDDHGGVMIQLGAHGSRNQVVDRCVIRNTRSWSTIQAFEGGYNIRITNNVIGPAGTEDTFKWADGISFAASDGLVAGNLIQDTTDGAIVLFNAPGTLVTSNTIITRTRISLGCINMVDPGPHDGNYGFTRVMHNTIITAGSMIKLGIGQGPSAWWTPSKRQEIRGGIVVKNLITRDLNHVHGPPNPSLEPKYGDGTIGYGFGIGSEVHHWTCKDNESDESVIYAGDISSTLPNHLNAKPGPFVHDAFGQKEGDEADIASMDLQKEFVRGKVSGLISIQPGPSRVLAYDVGQLHLKLGERIRLAGVEVHFRAEDSELYVVDVGEHGHGHEVLWQGGVHIGRHGHELHSAVLTFDGTGRLAIINAHNPSEVFWDFTPHLASHPFPRSPRPNTPRLVFSSSAPYISITSVTGDTHFASSYSVPRLAEFPIGKFIARPTPHSGGALIFTLSPERQFLVAHTRCQMRTVEWPITNPGDYNIVARAGPADAGGANDMGAKLVFQGDGNLVMYAGEGDASWSSGTCGEHNAADFLRFGLGTPEEPFLELVKKDGTRVWHI